VRQYLVITANYWAFTLTDGALRMLVVLHFHALGYGPLAIASLFLLYEIFGVVTNLVGGYLGARIGLNRTMHAGLALQVVALAALTVPDAWLTVPWVMAAQALSGIAKDLNKMSAKGAIKVIAPSTGESSTQREARLYRWIAILTGSKNALKGIGFFLGGLLLTTISFRGALFAMAAALAVVWVVSLLLVTGELGKAKAKPKFSELLSKSRAVNALSAARFFLFASRDAWFVIALPVYLGQTLGWSFWQVGGFLAAWIIGYGAVQSVAPSITKATARGNELPDGRTALRWAAVLLVAPVGLALALGAIGSEEANATTTTLAWTLVAGLAGYGVLFAVNSALHSYLIVSYATEDGVSLDVGFYYMSNAAGRLVGTLLSGWAFQAAGLGGDGLVMCLWISAACVVASAGCACALPRHGPNARPLSPVDAGD